MGSPYRASSSLGGSPVERPHLQRALHGQPGMELQRNARRRVDPGVEARRDRRIVRGVGLRALLRHLDGDLRWKHIEVLVSPDVAPGTSLDRAVVAGSNSFEGGVQQPQAGVGLRRRGRTQISRLGMSWQDVETVERLRERLDAEQRARRGAGGNVGICVGAARERTQSILEREESARGEDAHPEQVAPRDLAVSERFDDVRAIASSVLCFSQPGARCCRRKIQVCASPRYRPDPPSTVGKLRLLDTSGTRAAASGERLIYTRESS